jgi:hypothetical protein
MPAGQRTPPDVEEKVYSHYLLRLNYAETARSFDLPARTVINIVKRLAGDELAELRLAMRSDLAAMAWARIDDLLNAITPENLGTEHSSQGLEAARAARELARIARLLEPPEERDRVAPPPVIRVYPGVMRPCEMDHQDGEHAGGSIAGCADCQREAAGQPVGDPS